jgi:hypothetical protein
MYIFICTFQHPTNMPGTLAMAKTHIDQGLKFMNEKFKSDVKGIDNSWSECVTGCLQIALQLTQDRELYTAQQ